MFDYKESIENVKNILSSKTTIEKCERIPKDKSQFTYDNGVETYVSALFVDIRQSTKYFKKNDRVLVSKVMRAFFSEVISILRADENLRDIGIRGDCIYGIFTTPHRKDVCNVFNDARIINNFQKLFQRELNDNNMPNFRIGIGLGCGKVFVAKAGKKGTGVFDYIWIGNAVIDASNLSSIAGDNGIKTIAMNDFFYINLFYENGDSMINGVEHAQENYVEDIETKIWHI